MSDEPRQVAPVVEPWRRWLQRGTEALRAADFAAAADAFAQAYSFAPDQPEVLLALGRERLRSRADAEAELLLRRALLLDPTSAAAAAALARLLGLHLDRRQEAFDVLHAALRQNPGARALCAVRGELLLQDNAYQEARVAFAQALAQDVCRADDLADDDEAARTGMARTYNAEGIALHQQSHWAAAARAFRRASELAGDWSAPRVNLGAALAQLGQLEEAVEAYRAALLAEPDHPVALFNLATAQHDTGHPIEAQHAVERLIEACPDYPRARLLLAEVAITLGDYDRAIAVLLEQLDQDGSVVPVWASLGLAYVCSGSVERGEECLRRALALNPRHFHAHYNLALLCATQQRDEEARKLLVRARELDPERATRALARLPRWASLRQVEAMPRGLD